MTGRLIVYDDAITYAQRYTLHALLIEVGGEIVVARADDDGDLDRPHALYSGTKSFWGVAAGAAAEDGLLDLDAPLGATIGEWDAGDPRANVTCRQLLNLTAGYPFGGLGNAVPLAARALEIPLRDAPGTTFTYGGIPLQVFGEVLRRRLGGAAASPHAYLRERVLEPIGVTVDRWRSLRDGSHPLPTGASMRAAQWLAYGRFLLAGGRGVLRPESFAPCVTGSAVNPAYGLGLWLIPTANATTADPPAAFYASGAGGQGLYIIPDRDLVAVHFGRASSWSHAAFVKRLRTP